MMKTKTPVEILDSSLVLEIEKVVQQIFEFYRFFGSRLQTLEIQERVDIFLNGKVSGADIVMYVQTPIVRVKIRHKGKTYRVNKTSPFESLFGSGLHINFLDKNGQDSVFFIASSFLAPKILPLLPQDLVAMKMADIENASAAALQDPKKIGPIHKRFADKKAADKERYLARIREIFRENNDLVSKEEILQIWDETIVSEIQNS